MKKLLLIIFLIMISMNIFSLEKEKIAVLSFKAIKVDLEIANAVSEIITTSIAEYKKYDVIERTQIDKIFSELKLTSKEEFNDNVVLEIGKLVKAKLILVGDVNKLGNKYIINARIIEVETGKAVFGKNISCSDESELYDSAKKIAGFISDIKISEDEKNIQKEIVTKDFKIPEYKFNDKFDTFNTDVWVNSSKSEEINVKSVNNTLQFSGKYREGRLNSINTIYSKLFKVQSFAVEISFRDKLSSAESVSISVGNERWFRGGTLQVAANLEKEFYKFYWAVNSQWADNKDALVDFFNDESKKFHKLKIVYNMEKKIAYGYIDDILIDKVENFEFLRTDKINIFIMVSESVSETKKDVLVEFTDFNCSVDLR